MMTTPVDLDTAIERYAAGHLQISPRAVTNETELRLNPRGLRSIGFMVCYGVVGNLDRIRTVGDAKHELRLAIHPTTSME